MLAASGCAAIVRPSDGRPGARTHDPPRVPRAQRRGGRAARAPRRGRARRLRRRWRRRRAHRARRDPSRDRHRARRQQPRDVLLRARGPRCPATRAGRLQGRERRGRPAGRPLPRLRARRAWAAGARADGADAAITWRVNVANSKAAWYEFDTPFDIPGAQPAARRNDDVRGDKRQGLVIAPPEKSVRGAAAKPVALDGGSSSGSRSRSAS